MTMQKVHTYTMSAYPKEVTLRDGAVVTLKPMTESDADAVLEFFRGVPEADRFSLKEDVTSPQVIRRWAAELDYDRALPILAWVDGKVVGDGTLHRSRANARRHVGQVRVVVAPEFRERGLGTVMLHELAAIANENGLERLFFEAVAEQEAQAIQAAEYVGFVQAGVLTGHAKDADGHPRDIVLMEMPLGKWFDWWRF